MPPGGTPGGGVIDPVPDEVRRVALAAFGGRRPGAIVADLVHDSLIDDLDAPEGSTVRRLRFSDGGRLGVHVRVTVTASAERLLSIQTIPPRTATLDVMCGGWRRTISTDEAGHAQVGDVPAGLFGLLVSWDVGPPVQTARLVI